MAALNEQSVAAPAAAPFMQITRAGAIVHLAKDELPSIRTTFAEQHWLRLPNFLDTRLLELIEKKLHETEYCVVDRETGVELRPIDCTAYLAAELLLNNPKLFRAMEQITACERIACFSGRIYRRPASSTYSTRWHNDTTDEGRMLALSINLNAEPYEGGALQIRSSKTHEILCEV